MVTEAIDAFNWFNSTRVIFGVDRLNELPSVVYETAGNRSKVFLVTGRTFLRTTGILDRVLDGIGRDRVTLFDRVPPFPPPDLVDEAVKECRESGAEIVVGVGGGSPLDLAKAVAILTLHQEGTAREYALRERALERPGLPYIAVPTTSGSSSEVTKGAAFWDMEAKRSMGLSSPMMCPTVAIVDPKLAMTMPKSLAAASGMDAFTSAFESYWSTQAQPMTDAINVEVIRLYAENLERSCVDGDLESRSNCALASTMSGIAYSNSSPNICHAIGSPMTLHWGVDHGQSVGITLPSLLRWNAPAIEDRLDPLFNALSVRGLEDAVSRLTQIIDGCGLATRLSGLGIGEDDVEILVSQARWDRVAVLHETLDEDGLRSILHDIL